jgi:hypothetical protein
MSVHEPPAGRRAAANRDWTAATARARDEYSLLPTRYFVEHWFSWVAVERWPQLSARLRACERIVAESRNRTERRAAAAEISQILRQAETATASVAVAALPFQRAGGLGVGKGHLTFEL